MRWSDRPGPVPREPGTRGTGAERLAQRLDTLPAGHPSSAGYDCAPAEASDPDPALDQDGDEARIAAEGLAGEGPGEYGAADGAERAAADGQDRPGRGRADVADLAGRHPASRVTARARGEPYRPWFTAGEPAEPWFTAGQGGPPG